MDNEHECSKTKRSFLEKLERSLLETKVCSKMNKELEAAKAKYEKVCSKMELTKKLDEHHKRRAAAGDSGYNEIVGQLGQTATCTFGSPEGIEDECTRRRLHEPVERDMKKIVKRELIDLADGIDQGISVDCVRASLRALRRWMQITSTAHWDGMDGRDKNGYLMYREENIALAKEDSA
jgi:hypothetical protein